MQLRIVLTALVLVATGGCAVAPARLPAAETPPASPASPLPVSPTEATAVPTATERLPTATASLPAPPTEIPTDAPSTGVVLVDQPAAVGYRVPLLVRHLTPTTASFSFELDQPQDGYLLFRPDLPNVEGWFTVGLEPSSTVQQITLDGLRPGQTYLVQIGLGAERGDLHPVMLQGEPWGPQRIHVPLDGANDLRVGVIGDSGFGDSTTVRLTELMAQQQLDFVLHTGDLVYNVFEQDNAIDAWALKFFRPFAPLLNAAPVYAVPGNHEYDRAAAPEGRPFYYLAFPPGSDPALSGTPGFPWFGFSYSGIQFLMLDSQLFHGVAGRSEQTIWLRERLADPAYRYSIVVFHTPPFSSGLHPVDGLALLAEWTPLFESAAVPLVLSGHDHNYQRLQVNGVTYVVSGGGSSVLYPYSTEAEGGQVFARQSHFVLLEIGTDALNLTAIGADGQLLDQASILTP